MVKRTPSAKRAPVEVIEEEVEEEEVEEEVIGDIFPSQCTVAGLEDGRVGVEHEFAIEARDEDGRLIKRGGDAIFVAIRGASRVRARVTDMTDGTYAVRWTPPMSGTYTVSASLFGVSLGASPFRVSIYAPEAYAPNCEVRGDALHRISTRATHTFEMRYRDRTGAVAHPSALDVFVEPDATYLVGGAASGEGRPPSAWEAATGGQTPTSLMKAAGSAPAPAPARGGAPPGTPALVAVGEDEETGAEPMGEMGGTGAPGGAGGDPRVSRMKADRVQVGRHPLIVRATSDLASEQVGLLQPGHIITIVEELIDADGQGIRAYITYEEEAAAEGGLGLESGQAGGGATAPPPAAAGIVSTAGGSSVAGNGRFNPTSMATTARATEHMTARERRRLESVGGGYTALAEADAARRQRRELMIGGLDDEIGIADGGGSVDGSVDGSVVSARGVASTTLVAANGATVRSGWVTLKKQGKRLVRYRWKLPATERLEYMQQFKRRQFNDHMKYSVQSEVSCDDSHIGFAFGGVHPGWLHSKGNLAEVHKVSFSIGRVGRYLLHVRLRKAGAPIPGSPFALTVRPGPAHAAASRLPTAEQPLRGRVGTDPEDGCRMILRTHDQIGNASTAGGAHVENICKAAQVVGKVSDGSGKAVVDAKVTDNGDGSYLLEWRCVTSGLFTATVTIDKEPVGGSPLLIRLTSDTPELAKTELQGPGLREGIAGKPQTFQILLVDAFGNPCRPPEAFCFGMALEHETKKKMKVTDVKPTPFEGGYTDDESGCAP